MKLTIKLGIFLTIVTILIPLLRPLKVSSASATLFLSPPSGTHFVGDKFNVSIYISSATANNTYDVYLSTSNLTVNGISVGGSICILHPTPPSYNNISAHFRCGLPTPGYTGSGGYIGYISVKGNAPGTGKVFIDSNSQVLANDGAGTNILTNRGSATFTIQARPTSAPNVTSSTHPNQDVWYKAKTAILNWSGSGSAFSYSLDQNSDSTPDQISEGADTTKTFDNLADGVWYFHVIVKGSNNLWSGSAHFRLQVDSTPPEPFTPEADPKDNGDKRPIIAFSTTDKTSGIDHYELKLDDSKYERVNYPYQIPKVTSGKHTVYVKAVDKAGNSREASVEFTTKNITPPIINLPINDSTLPYGSNLLIKGKSIASYTIKLYLDDKEIGTVKSDKNGNFEFTYKELIRDGNHKIHAIAINPDNIESKKSNVVNFILDPKAYVILGQTIPASSVWISFLVLLIIVVLIFIFFWLGAKRFRKKIKGVLEKLEEEVETELDKAKVKKETKDKVEKDFDEAEEEVS